MPIRQAAGIVLSLLVTLLVAAATHAASGDSARSVSLTPTATSVGRPIEGDGPRAVVATNSPLPANATAPAGEGAVATPTSPVRPRRTPTQGQSPAVGAPTPTEDLGGPVASPTEDLGGPVASPGTPAPSQGTNQAPTDEPDQSPYPAPADPTATDEGAGTLSFDEPTARATQTTEPRATPTSPATQTTGPLAPPSAGREAQQACDEAQPCERIYLPLVLGAP
jgi:hypothetical protein